MGSFSSRKENDWEEEENTNDRYDKRKHLSCSLFQQMYTMVDTAVVGKYVSADALAGMGTTTPVITLILGIIIGMANGISVVIAQSFGSGDKRKTEKAVANGMILMLVLSLLVMGIGLISSRLLFYIMNVPDEILEDALIYVNILFLGTLSKAAYNYESGVLRAYGNSVVPLIFLAVTSVMNVLLDLLFVRIFSMGVMGVAMATVISETCSAVCCLIFMKKRMPEIHIAKDAWVIDKEMILRHIRTGIPSAFSQSCLGISFFFAQTALNSLGAASISVFRSTKQWALGSRRCEIHHVYFHCVYNCRTPAYVRSPENGKSFK